jgi:hypothetical protein
VAIELGDAPVTNDRRDLLYAELREGEQLTGARGSPRVYVGDKASASHQLDNARQVIDRYAGVARHVRETQVRLGVSAFDHLQCATNIVMNHTNNKLCSKLEFEEVSD